MIPGAGPGPLAAVAAVAAGGALGAVARFGVAAGMQAVLRGTAWAAYPVGTATVNVLGCLALGWLAWRPSPLPPELRLALATGFLGSFTTFSTFLVDADRLLRGPGPWAGGAYLLANVGLGWAAVLLGRRLALGG